MLRTISKLSIEIYLKHTQIENVMSLVLNGYIRMMTLFEDHIYQNLKSYRKKQATLSGKIRVDIQSVHTASFYFKKRNFLNHFDLDM